MPVRHQRWVVGSSGSSGFVADVVTADVTDLVAGV